MAKFKQIQLSYYQQQKIKMHFTNMFENLKTNWYILLNLNHTSSVIFT